MTSMITARVDAQKRKVAEKVFSEVGLSTSAAVNIFICAVAMNGGIPFKIQVNAQDLENRDGAQRSPSGKGGVKIGIADGRYGFKSDFDKRFDDMDSEVAEMFR